MMVGAAGFEPTTPTPPVWCATRLRYAPPKLPAPPIRQGKPGCACIAEAPGEGNARLANQTLATTGASSPRSADRGARSARRSEEQKSELQSLMRNSYAHF